MSKSLISEGNPRWQQNVKHYKAPKSPRDIKCAREFSDEDCEAKDPTYVPNSDESNQRRLRLSLDEKTPFEALEKQDGERYEQEAAAYKPDRRYEKNGDIKLNNCTRFLPNPQNTATGDEPEKKRSKKSMSSSFCSYSDLPARALREIALFPLEKPRDAFQMRCVCSSWYRAFKDEPEIKEGLWKLLVRKCFPHLFRETKEANRVGDDG